MFFSNKYIKIIFFLKIIFDINTSKRYKNKNKSLILKKLFFYKNKVGQIFLFSIKKLYMRVFSTHFSNLKILSLNKKIYAYM